MFHPAARFPFHCIDRTLPDRGTPLGRLLADPPILALERVYDLHPTHAPRPRLEAHLWTDDNGLTGRTLLLGPDISPPGAGTMDTTMAHAITQALAENFYSLVALAQSTMYGDHTPEDRTIRVLMMDEGWVLLDGDADDHHAHFAALDDQLRTPGTPYSTLQDTADRVNWSRFCMPFLPIPHSAHHALTQHSCAERVIARTMRILATSGITTLEHLDWIATPAP